MEKQQNKKQKRRKITIGFCQEHAESKKGKCLSTEYKNNKIKLEWECEEKHTWFATPGHVLGDNCWCPYCARNIPLTIEICQKHAESKKGKCLSTEYTNNYTNLEWECREKHTWFATPSNILNNNQWCPYCAKVAKLTIEICQKHAESKKGKCLSTEYTNAHTKLEWECEEKHTWFATPSNILNNNQWCPYCANDAKKLTIEICQEYAESKKGNVYQRSI